MHVPYCLIEGAVFAEIGEEVGIISEEGTFATALFPDSDYGPYIRYEVLPPPEGDADYVRPGFVGIISESKRGWEMRENATRIQLQGARPSPSPSLHTVPSSCNMAQDAILSTPGSTFVVADGS
jgi:hypothetical protein